MTKGQNMITGSCKHCYRDSGADHAEANCPVLDTPEDDNIQALEVFAS